MSDLHKMTDWDQIKGLLADSNLNDKSRSIDESELLARLLTRSFSGHSTIDPFQVGEVGEVDRDPAALGTHLNAHARVEVARQQLLQLEQTGRT